MTGIRFLGWPLACALALTQPGCVVLGDQSDPMAGDTDASGSDDSGGSGADTTTDAAPVDPDSGSDGADGPPDPPGPATGDDSGGPPIDDPTAPPRKGSTLSQFLAHAVTVAEQIDPEAELYFVIGMGVLPDGTIDLTSSEDLSILWWIRFITPTSIIDVEYAVPYFPTYPMVGVMDLPPGPPPEHFLDPAVVPDSDALIGVAQGTGCFAATHYNHLTVHSFEPPYYGQVSLLGFPSFSWLGWLHSDGAIEPITPCG